jgi:hypothetical protein
MLDGSEATGGGSSGSSDPVAAFAPLLDHAEEREQHGEQQRLSGGLRHGWPSR